LAPTLHYDSVADHEETGPAVLLELDAVNAFYGRAHILFDLSFGLDRGEVVALLGRNGAGKSTTLKTIIGLVRAASGRIAFDGREITRLESHAIARLGVGYVPEDRRVFAELTVAENLVVGRQPPRPGAPTWDEERVVALFPKLGELWRRPAGALSGGEQQMVTIARTLMGNPTLLLLDEPSEGLAPVVVDQMAAAVGRLKAEGLAVLLSEQNLRFATAVGDRACIVEKGRLRFRGTIAELSADPAIRQAYLSA